MSLAFASGSLYVGNYIDGADDVVDKFAAGATSSTPTLTFTGVNEPTSLAFDSSGNLYVANYGNNTVSKFTVFGTKPAATFGGLNAPAALAFESGELYVGNFYGGTVSEFTTAITATPTAGGVVIRSSLPNRPMSLGGTNNAVAGIDLTQGELAQIRTTASGTLTVGDSTQTGNITLTTATLATTPAPRPQWSKIPPAKGKSSSMIAAAARA